MTERKTEHWNGFEKQTFLFEGKQAILVFPRQPDARKNWLLKMEYWDAFPAREKELVACGFHLAYLQNETRFATRADCDRKARFVDFLHRAYGLREKCVPVGMSCGGAHAVNFAGYYPEKTVCVYLDAPVLNFCSYPGRPENPECERVWQTEFIKAYPGIERHELLNFPDHPLNRTRRLQECKIPVIMLYGTQDETVPYSENGKLLELAYRKCPELLTVIPRNLQGHHPHGELWQPERLIRWILAACGCEAERERPDAETGGEV